MTELGIRVGLRNRILGVRVSPVAPNYAGMAQLGRGMRLKISELQVRPLLPVPKSFKDAHSRDVVTLAGCKPVAQALEVRLLLHPPNYAGLTQLVECCPSKSEVDGFESLTPHQFKED